VNLFVGMKVLVKSSRDCMRHLAKGEVYTVTKVWKNVNGISLDRCEIKGGCDCDCLDGYWTWSPVTFEEVFDKIEITPEEMSRAVPLPSPEEALAFVTRRKP